MDPGPEPVGTGGLNQTRKQVARAFRRGDAAVVVQDYADALARLFTDLGVGHLRDPLAARGPAWLQATFPSPLKHFERTGELHRDLGGILNALT